MLWLLGRKKSEPAADLGCTAAKRNPACTGDETARAALYHALCTASKMVQLGTLFDVLCPRSLRVFSPEVLSDGALHKKLSLRPNGTEISANPPDALRKSNAELELKS